MLKVYHSNQLERLLAGLLDHLDKPLADPLAPEVVVVQSQGMARWLSLELAKGQGIAANLDFPFLSVCVWRLFQAVLPGLPERPAFDRARLVWRLLPLLPRVRTEPGFEAIDRYLEDGSEHKRYQLARRIAELFDQYLVYRPDWILSWGQGKPTAVTKEQSWQPRLWRLLCEASGRSTQAQALSELRTMGVLRGNGAELAMPELLSPFLERLRDPGLDLSVLPERISLFGLSALAPAYLQVFEALSHRIEVHLYLLNPCLAYWGDVVSRNDRARLRTQRKRHSRSMAVAAYCTAGNPLLASMGKLGRDFQEELADHDCDDHEWFREPTRDHLLGWLQADILYLIDRSEPLPEDDQPSLFQESEGRHPKIPLRDDDASIQVHSCHSPLREVEVLHDGLLGLFERDPSLQPGDVLVIAPDIDVYAPLVEAVFGAAPEERQIPYAVADRTAPREHPVIRCLIKLLDLPRSRLTASEVLGLLETPSVAERFGLDQPRLALVRRWVDAAGVRWGRDAADRAELDLPGFDANSWRAGMDRLLLGFALPEAEQVFAGIAPLAAVQGQETETLGALQSFLAALAQARATLAESRTVTAWVAVVQGMIETFFAEDGQPSAPLSLVRAALADIQASAAGCEEAVGSRVLVDELEQRLSARDSGRNFLTGRLTFANLVPMRSIPFRVICLLGANNQDFPRRERAPGFDLMAAKPRLGDRSRRDDDRYLFLETLICARDCLYLSYVGRSQRDNSQAQPSVLVSELLDLIDAGFETADGGLPSARLVREHSLQPFDRRNFGPGGPHPQSYAAEWLPGARALAGDPLGRALPPFLDEPLPLPPDGAREVDLDDLVRFLRHPTRYFFNRRLGIRLEPDAVAIADTEAFGLAPLERHALREELLERLLDDDAGDHHYGYLAASGRLPVGAFGDLAYEEADAEVQDLAERLGRLAGATPTGNRVGNEARNKTALEVDLRVQDVRLTGWLRPLTSEGLVSYRAAKLTAADRLSLWVLHLVLNVLAPAGYPPRSRHLALDRDLEFPPLADAAERLSRLLAAYREGLRRPLKLYPEASLAYVERLARGEDPERALQAARRTWSAKRDGAEGASPYYRMLYRRREEPFDASFEALATELAGPVVALGRMRTPEAS